MPAQNGVGQPRDDPVHDGFLLHRLSNGSLK
jgi:hypothetical protein